ncbi:hypothetical protein CEXT_472151 [Caerostris extrusa]|uniref:Chitin-binding type-2 domain-containing protein n=1 Tax=Caerostris extrusa TaxID=172846 RepID=A0AAV4UV30_CAEEX|nr:hypothetical protein CEXT_472151 [Caerostris extrusa]
MYRWSRYAVRTAGQDMQYVCTAGQDMQYVCTAGQDMQHVCTAGQYMQYVCTAGQDMQYVCTAGQYMQYVCTAGQYMQYVCTAGQYMQYICTAGQGIQYVELVKRSSLEKNAEEIQRLEGYECSNDEIPKEMISTNLLLKDVDNTLGGSMVDKPNIYSLTNASCTLPCESESSFHDEDRANIIESVQQKMEDCNFGIASEDSTNMNNTIKRSVQDEINPNCRIVSTSVKEPSISKSWLYWFQTKIKQI